MMRCFFQSAQGCVPVAPRRSPIGSTSDWSCARRSAMTPGTSANDSCLTGTHLHFRRDELAYEVLLERRPARRGLDVLEAVREVERLRVDDRELLLDGDREVGRGLELLACPCDQLVRRETLLVAHRRTTVVEVLASDPAGGVGRRRSPNSNARRLPVVQLRRSAARSPGESDSSSASFARRSAASPVVNDVRWRNAGGYSASSPSATSASPECRATRGGQPADAASAATIPNASGKIDGTTQASASASRWTRCRCSSGPVKRTRSASAMASSSSR